MTRLLLALLLWSSGLPATGQVQAPAEPPSAQAPTVPEEAPPLPPARTHYMGREIAPTMSYEAAPWLIRKTREREESCSELVEALRLRPGQVVCDFGCGNGFYTLRFAERVGARGRVLAVDIQPEMLELLGKRSAAHEVENVEPILGTVADPRLPKGEVDLVFMADVYHELSHPKLVLKAVRDSLKPDGRIVLVEYRAEDPKVPIKKLHKMSKAQVLKELLANGFRLDVEYDELPWQHVMFFLRDDAPERASETSEDG